MHESYYRLAGWQKSCCALRSVSHQTVILYSVLGCPHKIAQMCLPFGLASTTSSSGKDNKAHAQSRTFSHEANKSALLFCDLTTEQSAEDFHPLHMVTQLPQLVSYINLPGPLISLSYSAVCNAELHSREIKSRQSHILQELQLWQIYKKLPQRLNTRMPPFISTSSLSMQQTDINNTLFSTCWAFSAVAKPSSMYCTCCGAKRAMRLMTGNSTRLPEKKHALQGTMFWPHQPRPAHGLCWWEKIEREKLNESICVIVLIWEKVPQLVLTLYKADKDRFLLFF